MRVRPTRLVGVLFCALIAASCARHAPPRPDYPLQAVPVKDVLVTDSFWAPKIAVNQTVSLRHCLRMMDETGSFDTPKLIEAAAYMLALHRDPSLEPLIDERIERLVKSVESRIRRPEQAVHISGHYLEAAAAY